MLTKHRLKYNFRIFRSYFRSFPIVGRRIAAVVSVDAQPVHLATIDNFFATHKGTLFSTLHATTQAPQPVQVFRSMAIPQW